MLRRTKIVATLGPATDKPGVLEQIVRAGVDVVRINFSHGAASDHEQRVAAVRVAAAAVGKDVGILADLQGPKIRIERFRDGAVMLVDGAPFVLDAALAVDGGSVDSVGITYKALPSDVRAGDRLLLNDGLIVLVVERVAGSRIECRVESGGELSNSKGINRQGGGLTAKALTDKDLADIRVAAALGVDYVAISFPRDAADVEEARRLVRAAGSQAGIIAKIERAEAITHLEGIVKASDAVMVARGDLAVEIGDAELPGVQKHVIQVARDLNKVVITATQMMESMIANPVPTRAEVLDVANAVMDGTDAVMLSAETASGRFPVKVVEAMARVCMGAEKERMTQRSKHRLDSHFDQVDEAIAMATMYVANHLDVKAIGALTESGSTALWMSRIRSGMPIYALTRHDTTRRRVTLYRGVYPIAFDVTHADDTHVLREAADELLRRGAVARGDLVVFTKGDFSGVTGGTNGLKIERVGAEVPRGLRILMVCGDDDLAPQLATALRGYGCFIEGARDADDALERLRQADAPQVAVLGDVAGSREPSETARRLRASFPDRQLMVLVVVRDATDLERALAAGADEVLRVPFATREFEVRLRGLRRALDLHRTIAGHTAHDPLTKLWTHAMVAGVLANELARAERTLHPVSVLLIDVDGFAGINSEHGHRVGDEVLGEVAQRVRVALRSYDLAGRFGGDEFLVVLPNRGRANAIEVAQRVRRAMAEAPILLLKAKVELTLSVGISTTEKGKKTTAADMIAAAETALDDAKRMGRDRVEVAGAVRGDRRDSDRPTTEKL